jgi:hypothetical protein
MTEAGHAGIVVGTHLDVFVVPEELQDFAEAGDQVSLWVGKGDV